MLNLRWIMGQTISKLAAGTLCVMLLSACAGSSDKYPSLAIRDVERVSGQFAGGPEVKPVDLPIPPLTPDRNIASLLEAATGSHERFLAREPSVRRLATSARGAGVDSLLRGNALVALSDLTSLRSQTEIALADLDLLIAERTNRLEPADDAVAAHAQVLTLIGEQDRTLNALWGLLGR